MCPSPARETCIASDIRITIHPLQHICFINCTYKFVLKNTQFGNHKIICFGRCPISKVYCFGHRVCLAAVLCALNMLPAARLAATRQVISPTSAQAASVTVCWPQTVFIRTKVTLKDYQMRMEEMSENTSVTQDSKSATKMYVCTCVCTCDFCRNE